MKFTLQYCINQWILLLSIFSVGLNDAWAAGHLWHPMSGGYADIMSMEVMVEKTAPSTYYETLGWNQGRDGGGYTGIQTTSSNKTAYIFSLWDPKTTTKTMDATDIIYKNPKGYVKRFSEGSGGMHYINNSLNWSVGQRYATVVRSWPSETSGYTAMGMWSYGVTEKTWTLHAIFDYPSPNMHFKSSLSFLENYNRSAPMRNSRKAYFGHGWARGDKGMWYPFVSARADNNQGDFGVEDNFFYLQIGVPLKQSARLYRKAELPPFVNEESSNNKRKSLYGAGEITDLQGSYDEASKILTVKWAMNPALPPQFSYHFQITDGTAVGKVLADSRRVKAPHIQSLTFNMRGKTVVADSTLLTLEVDDIFDQPSFIYGTINKNGKVILQR